jgi:hypothetical protein
VRLIDVPKAIVKLAIAAQGAMSPRVSARGEVIAISVLRADEDASSVLGMVAAGVGRLLGQLWVDIC